MLLLQLSRINNINMLVARNIEVELTVIRVNIVCEKNNMSIANRQIILVYNTKGRMIVT